MPFQPLLNTQTLNYDLQLLTGQNKWTENVSHWLNILHKDTRGRCSLIQCTKVGKQGWWKMFWCAITMTNWSNRQPSLINNGNQIDWMNGVNLIKRYIKPVDCWRKTSVQGGCTSYSLEALSSISNNNKSVGKRPLIGAVEESSGVWSLEVLRHFSASKSSRFKGGKGWTAH